MSAARPPGAASRGSDKSMAVLVTGGTGFVGSHLLKGLLADGHEVVVLKRSTSDLTRVRPLLGEPGLSFVDIDRDGIAGAFAAAPVEAAVHVATSYGRGGETLASILEANLIFPVELIELCVQHRVRAFVNTDSYFCKEKKSYSALPNYSLSKQNLLPWLKKFSDRIMLVNACLEHVYGAHDSPTKFCEDLIRKVALQRVDSHPLTHGHQKRDFVHVDDVVRAYVAIVRRSVEKESGYAEVNVGTGRSVEIRAFAETVKRLSGSPTDLRFGAIPYRDDEIMNSAADTRALSAMGVELGIGIEEGIADILSRYGVSSAG